MFHLAFQLDQLLLQMLGFCRQLLGWLLPVGSVELRQIARHAPLQLEAASLHFVTREVLVTGVDGFELAAVDRDARRHQQAHLPAQFNKLHADLLDRSPTVLAEVGYRLVVRSELP